MQVLCDNNYLETLILSRRSLKKVAELFGLSEDKINDPNCGDWLVDMIKQLLTQNNMYKAMLKEHSDNGSVAEHAKIASTLPSLDDTNINQG